MEGLLILLLIGWTVKSLSQAALRSKKGNTAAQPSVKVVLDEAQKVKIQQARQMMQQMTIPMEEEEYRAPAEGECAPEHMHSAEGEYRGSMEAVATEGMDFCDPALEHARRISPDPESVYAGEIGSQPVLDLSSRGIYQAVVMSEVLARPAQRRR